MDTNHTAIAFPTFRGRPAARYVSGSDGRLSVTLNASVGSGGRIIGGLMPAKHEQHYIEGFTVE
jgi:hypothetical protein